MMKNFLRTALFEDDGTDSGSHGGLTAQQSKCHSLLERVDSSAVYDERVQALHALRDAVQNQAPFVFDDESLRLLARFLDPSVQRGPFESFGTGTPRFEKDELSLVSATIEILQHIFSPDDNDPSISDSSTYSSGDIDTITHDSNGRNTTTSTSTEMNGNRHDNDNSNSNSNSNSNGNANANANATKSLTDNHSSDADKESKVNTSPAALNALAFVRTPNNVALVLDLLSYPSTRLAVLTIQLLAVLLENRQSEVQSIILGHPMGVNQLSQLIRDQRDIVRNQSLLLLELLLQRNQTIQGIVAFDNAFDTLLRMTHDEGGLDGGVVAEDCLRVIKVMLTDNSSNQKLIVEQACVPHFASLLVAPNKSPELDNEQYISQCEILSLALQCTECIVSTFSGVTITPSLQHTQSKLSVVVEPLALLCTQPTVDAQTRSTCMRMIGDIVKRNARNQEILSSFVIPQYQWSPAPQATAPTAPIAPTRSRFQRQTPAQVPKPPKYALEHYLHAALDAVDDMEKSAAEFVLECFLLGNKLGQMQLISSFTPVMPSPSTAQATATATAAQQMHQDGKDKDTQPQPLAFGATLLTSLGSIAQEWQHSQEGYAVDFTLRSCTAARILTLVFRDNWTAKEVMLNIPVPADAAPSQTTPLRIIGLVLSVLRTVGDAINVMSSQPNALPPPFIVIFVLSQVALLRVLCEWIHGCTECMFVLLKDDPDTLEFLFSHTRVSKIPLPQQPASVEEPDAIKILRYSRYLQEVHSRSLVVLTLALCLEYTACLADKQSAEAKRQASPHAGLYVDGVHSSAGLEFPALLELIGKRIGIEQFKQSLASLHHSTEITSAKSDTAAKFTTYRLLSALQRGPNDPPANPQTTITFCHKPIFDGYFTSLVEMLTSTCDKRLLSLYSFAMSLSTANTAAEAPPSAHRALSEPSQASLEAQQRIQSLEQKLEQSEHHVRDLEHKLNSANERIVQLENSQAQAQAQAQAQPQANGAVEQDQSRTQELLDARATIQEQTAMHAKAQATIDSLRSETATQAQHIQQLEQELQQAQLTPVPSMSPDISPSPSVVKSLEEQLGHEQDEVKRWRNVAQETQQKLQNVQQAHDNAADAQRQLDDARRSLDEHKHSNDLHLSRIHQLETELADALATHSSVSGDASNMGMSALLPMDADTAAAIADWPADKLRTSYLQLESEHEDLLVLLASQQVEKQQLLEAMESLQSRLEISNAIATQNQQPLIHDQQQQHQQQQ
jgi:hypothetical protein